MSFVREAASHGTIVRPGHVHVVELVSFPWGTGRFGRLPGGNWGRTRRAVSDLPAGMSDGKGGCPVIIPQIPTTCAGRIGRRGFRGLNEAGAHRGQAVNRKPRGDGHGNCPGGRRNGRGLCTRAGMGGGEDRRPSFGQSDFSRTGGVGPT